MGQLLKMQNPIQDYAWGTRDTLARMRGAQVPAERPEAELWVGAHPSSPSVVQTPQGERPLSQWVAEAPQDLLPAGREEFPFLFKILAIGGPLSLQVHPNDQQAAEGFAREEAQGIPLDAPHRNYKDARSKPETLIALSPVRILTGIRPAEQIKEIAQALNLTWLAELAGYSADEIVRAVFAKSEESTAMALEGTVLAAAEYAAAHPFDEDAPGDPAHSASDRLAALTDLVLLLQDAYPGDRGILVAVAMNQLFLQPGESACTPVGVVHAYIQGTAIEIMNASDNVMRAGLTPKHIDLPEMLSVLVPEQPAPAVCTPEPVAPGVDRYQLWDPRLAVTRISVTEQAPVEYTAESLAAVLCTEGEVLVSGAGTEHRLTGTESLLHAGTADRLQFRGSGQVFIAESR